MAPRALRRLDRLKPYIPGKPIEQVKRELGLARAYKLASNENPFGPSPKGLAAARRALFRSHRYPEGGGFELRKSLSRLWKLAPDHFIFGNGSDEILLFAVQAYAGNSGAVAFSARSFAVYEIAARLCGSRELRVPSPDFTHDLDALARAGRRAKVLFVCNPNNPSGSWHGPKAIEGFLKKVPSSTLVVLDEAYAEFAGQPLSKSRGWVRRFPNLLITRTFSKLYGLAGLRIGYGLADPGIIRQLEKCRPPFNTSLVAQEAARAALEDSSFVSRTLSHNARELKRFSAFFRERGIYHLESRTNFMLFKSPVEGLADWLLKRGMIIRPLEPGFLRVTVGTKAENTLFLKLLGQRLA